jgi:predicted NBD/HSP70 family sugar kinase
MRIGIDLGGTKIEAVVLDDAGSIAFRERRAAARRLRRHHRSDRRSRRAG